MFERPAIASWFPREFWGALRRARLLHRRGSSLSLLAIIAHVAGCAVVYDDDNGTKHIIGLANVEIRRPADERTIAGDVVDVTVVGVAIYNTEVHGGLVLGYSRNVTAAIRDHALVLGNPLQAIRTPRPAAIVEDASSGKNKR